MVERRAQLHLALCIIRPSPRIALRVLTPPAPDGQRMQPPDFELVVETTPMSTCRPLAGTAPAAWVRTVCLLVQDLLFCSQLWCVSICRRAISLMRCQYLSLMHPCRKCPCSASIPCISVSVVYLGLRSTGFALASSTFWIVLCQRALHLDLLSVRECAVAIEAFARTHDVPHNAAVFDMSDAASDAALTAAAAALQGSAMALRMASVEPCLLQRRTLL